MGCYFISLNSNWMLIIQLPVTLSSPTGSFLVASYIQGSQTHNTVSWHSACTAMHSPSAYSLSQYYSWNSLFFSQSFINVVLLSLYSQWCRQNVSVFIFPLSVTQSLCLEGCRYALYPWSLGLFARSYAYSWDAISDIHWSLLSLEIQDFLCF